MKQRLKKGIEKINETKSTLFEKIKLITKLDSQTHKKQRAQINKIKMKQKRYKQHHRNTKVQKRLL